MIMRLLNIIVVVALVAAAAHVYKIKYDATRQAEKVAKLRRQIRAEHDAIATLRARWSKLDNPARIQALAERHLKLRLIDPHQFDDFKHLAPRPPDLVPPGTDDPIAFLLENPQAIDLTSSIPASKRSSARTHAPSSIGQGGDKR
jgi:cell division protein FtsL